MGNLILQVDNAEDLNLLKELADRLGIRYVETEKFNYTFEDVLKIVKQFPDDYSWHYQDLVDHFPEDLNIKVEIIANHIFVMPTPSTAYQLISDELVFQFNLFVRKNKLGKVLAAPMDVKFDEDNVVQPDILFIAVTRYEIIEDKNIQGVPNLVVEIWSPSNHPSQREEKRSLYQKSGVTEFWQIFPKKKHVQIEVLNAEGTYEVFSEAETVGCIQSKVLQGFEVDITDLFEAI